MRFSHALFAVQIGLHYRQNLLLARFSRRTFTHLLVQGMPLFRGTFVAIFKVLMAKKGLLFLWLISSQRLMLSGYVQLKFAYILATAGRPCRIIARNWPSAKEMDIFWVEKSRSVLISLGFIVFFTHNRLPQLVGD